jgi:hypothetical protein
MMVVATSQHEENAMNDFLKKFAHLIIGTLSCFDRVIFKGHLPFGDDAHLNAFVDNVLKIRRKDFLSMLEKLSGKLVDHAKSLAETAGRPYEYHQGKFRKEAYIQNMIRQSGISEGLVAVLCCQETCRTVKLRYGDKRPYLQFAYRPQRVLYY